MQYALLFSDLQLILALMGSHSHPQVRWSMQLVTQDDGKASPFQEEL
jgi:hypothetical protein